jgi:hypothetical protein
MLLVACFGACHSPSKGEAGAGKLDVSWTGREPGSMSAPATASWCTSRHLLEVRGIQGDTGLALALYPADTLTAGVYRVVDPTRAESLPPAASVALRWLTPKVVQGFRGEGGTVRLERSRLGQVSGEVSARARSVVDTQRLTIRGTFRDLTLQREPPECGRAVPSATPKAAAGAKDTSVH